MECNSEEKGGEWGFTTKNIEIYTYMDAMILQISKANDEGLSSSKYGWSMI